MLFGLSVNCSPSVSATGSGEVAIVIGLSRIPGPNPDGVGAKESRALVEPGADED